MKESGHEGQPPFRIETGVCITFENMKKNQFSKGVKSFKYKLYQLFLKTTFSHNPTEFPTYIHTYIYLKYESDVTAKNVYITVSAHSNFTVTYIKSIVVIYYRKIDGPRICYVLS